MVSSTDDGLSSRSRLVINPLMCFTLTSLEILWFTP
jgi:hypothetical protein